MYKSQNTVGRNLNVFDTLAKSTLYQESYNKLSPITHFTDVFVSLIRIGTDSKSEVN
ncbi:hypothetical protein HanRHA438_Chr03g0108501 [Helianthus annuus]|nr:hypothetical protein HanRHA438_Chr03g0108501 [Helianthus annuus]